MCLFLNLKKLYCFISVKNLALPMSTIRQCIDSSISKNLQMLTYLAAWYFQAWFQQSANLQMTFTEHKSTLEYPQLLHRKQLETQTVLFPQRLYSHVCKANVTLPTLSSLISSTHILYQTVILNAVVCYGISKLRSQGKGKYQSYSQRKFHLARQNVNIQSQILSIFHSVLWVGFFFSFFETKIE